MEQYIPWLWVVAAYVIGSIPFGLIISKSVCGIDPRLDGSGNIGSTNVARLCGKRWGVATLACDMLKGAVPVIVALSLSHGTLLPTMTALAAIFGHLFSCFLHFRGGKAVATSIGALIPLAFLPLLLACLLCVLVVWRSGFVSLGSLTLVTSLPLILLATGRLGLIPLSLAVMVIVYWSHRENIRRLLRGEEKTWIRKKE